MLNTMNRLLRMEPLEYKHWRDSTKDPRNKLKRSSLSSRRKTRRKLTSKVGRQFPERTYPPQQNLSQIGIGTWQSARSKTISKMGIQVSSSGVSSEVEIRNVKMPHKLSYLAIIRCTWSDFLPVCVCTHHTYFPQIIDEYPLGSFAPLLSPYIPWSWLSRCKFSYNTWQNLFQCKILESLFGEEGPGKWCHWLMLALKEHSNRNAKGGPQKWSDIPGS